LFGELRRDHLRLAPAKNVTPQVVHVEGDPDIDNRGAVPRMSLEQDIMNERG